MPPLGMVEESAPTVPDWRSRPALGAGGAAGAGSTEGRVLATHEAPIPWARGPASTAIPHPSTDRTLNGPVVRDMSSHAIPF
jgi:hypothetical protein